VLGLPVAEMSLYFHGGHTGLPSTKRWLLRTIWTWPTPWQVSVTRQLTTSGAIATSLPWPWVAPTTLPVARSTSRTCGA
jgi:hypothetical protein